MTGSSKIGADTAKPKRVPPNAGKGRPPGAKNKTTVAVKAALTAAFDELGGVEALVTWGRGAPTEFYKLWGRLLPLEVSGPDGEAVGVRLTDELAALPKERRDALRAALASAMAPQGA